MDSLRSMGTVTAVGKANSTRSCRNRNFLQACFEDSFARARVGAGELIPWGEIFERLSPEARASLEPLGQEERRQIFTTFDDFALHSLQRIGAVDVLHLKKGD